MHKHHSENMYVVGQSSPYYVLNVVGRQVVDTARRGFNTAYRCGGVC